MKLFEAHDFIQSIINEVVNIMKTLKEQYFECLLKYSEAYKAIFEDKVEGKDYAKFSRQEKSAAKKSREIYFQLKELNALNEIAEYMENDNPYIRYVAAVDSLIHNPIKAENVLEQLIESENHKIQMHSKTALKQWRKIPWTEERYK